jgi:hypothetical protein
MKKAWLIAIGMTCSASMMAQDLIHAPSLYDISSTRVKKNDFGLSFNLGLEKKIRPGFSIELESELRTQDNSSMIERFMLGAGVNYRLFQTMDKRFSIKSGLGFQYIWRQTASSVEDFDRIREHYTTIQDDDGNDVEALNGFTQRKGYQTTEAYWRNRHRTNLSLTGTFSPSKRWSFSLKETFQYTHYNSTDSIPRMRHNEEYYKWRESGDYWDEEGTQPKYYDANAWAINGDGDFYVNPDAQAVPFDDENKKSPRKKKDKLVLRSKFTVKYNVKGIPLNPYANVDYGVGLNHTANKWKLSVGSEYKINKVHELNLFYRYSSEDDDDDPNGHLIGVGYKFNF